MRATTRSGVAAAVLLSAAVCASCSSPPESPPPRPATSSTSSTPTVSADPQAATKTKIIEAYKGFLTERDELLSHPYSIKGVQLTSFASGEALERVYAAAIAYRRNGIYLRGAVKTNPVVSELNISKMGSTVVDCLDSSQALPFFERTGKSALAPNQPLRVTVIATVQNERGHWLVTKWIPDRRKSC